MDDRRRETEDRQRATAGGKRRIPESASPRSPVPGLVTLIETAVTYTLFHEGNFYVIEHVPARVCRETGEEFFAPETVERIQALVKGKKKPDRMVSTPVYEYA